MQNHKIRNMDEFAERSGVSRPTVSKYFNDPESVRPTTRAKIEDALERFEYRPNIFAINQNRSSTNNVGIVVPYLTDPYFAEIARKLEGKCTSSGYRPTLFSPYGRSDLEVEILDNIRALKPAGVLLAPLGRASDREAIEKFCADIPTVLFDSELEHVGSAFVGSDNYSFVSETVEYLLRSGSAPCFFEMRSPANPNANKRRNAFLELMARHGHDDPAIIRIEGEGWAFEEIGRAGALRVLESGGFPSNTILCSNDRLAMGLLAACYEKGLRVGHGQGCALRVASLDGHPFSAFTCPSLTTAAHDYEAVSDRAVAVLRDLIEAKGQFDEREIILFPAKLVLRGSA